MKRHRYLVPAVAATVFYSLVACESESPKTGDEKVSLRVLYVGHRGTEREKDFVGFLEKHFTKVAKGDLDKVEEKDAEGFDVVVLDYSGLTIKGNAIIVPRMSFDKSYSRPVLTIGAAGAVTCDMLGLKTGYL